MSYETWRERFGEVLDMRFYSLEWLDGQVASGRAQLWEADGAALLTEVRAYPSGGRIVHALIAAGDMRVIADELASRAEAWGRENGCVQAAIESREGWARIMKQHGYRLYQVAIRKEL